MSDPATVQPRSPLYELWRDQKFRLALLDAIGSTILLLATRFLSPADVDLIKQLIVIVQPVAVAAMIGLVVENREKIIAQARIDEVVMHAKMLAAASDNSRLVEPEPTPARSRKG